MSRRSSAAKQQWEARRATYGDELRDRIVQDAIDRMQTWTARGRIPWWIRVKARFRGQRIAVSGRGRAR